MKRFKKKIAFVSVLAITMSALSNFAIGQADGRLTEFQDVMSRIKRSGTGAATSGYTESNTSIRSKFVFTDSYNEQICVDTAGDGLDGGGCATDDDVLVDLIDDSAMLDGTAYSGSEVAEYISEAIEAAIRNAAIDTDDSYTVIYNDSASNNFVFAEGENEDIYVSYDGVGPGDATLDLISDAGLTAHTAYTGAEVATALAAALNTLDTDANDDVYTVTYSTTTDFFTIEETGGGTNGIYFDWDAAQSTAALSLGFTADDDLAPSSSVYSDVPANLINRFQIRGDGGNTLNPDILWSDANSTAYATLGYAAVDSSNIRDSADVGDSQVQFNVIAGVNDEFLLDLDGESPDGTETMTVDAGVYTGVSLAAHLDTEIDDDWDEAGACGVTCTATVSATYTNEKFTITSDATGTESYVHVESGTNDFLPFVDMINDKPKDGQATNVIVSSDHTLTFRTNSAVPASGYVEITFPSGFYIPADLDYADIDFAYGATIETATQQILVDGVGNNSATEVGVTVTTGDAGSVLFHLQTDEGITASHYVEIRIGRNTGNGPTGDVTGVEQIVNPSVPGMFQIKAETMTADLLTFTSATNEDIVWDPDGVNAFVLAAGVNENIVYDPDGSGLPGDETVDLIDDSSTCSADTEYTGAQMSTCIEEALETYGFIITADTNEQIRVSWDGTGPGDVTVDLIDDGGLVSGTAVTGDEVAAALQTILNTDALSGDDTYTVTYAEATGLFTITATAGTNGVYLDWDDPLSTAATTMGYTADGDIDSGGTATDISDQAATMQNTYSVSYNTTTDKFTITQATGTSEVNIDWNDAGSTAARSLGYTADDQDLDTTGQFVSDIIAGTYILDLVADGGLGSGTAYAGAAVATAIDTALELAIFPNEAPDNTFTVSYASNGFTIANDTVDEYPAFYWTWNESTASYTLGYTADDATSSTTFSYASDINADTKQIDTAYTAVYIVDNDQITVSAGVDPNLEMEINGGLAYAQVEGDRDTLGVDFGALEPNAYYKLGGAKTEYVKIEVDSDCGTTGSETCIPATDEYVTIRGNNYYFKRVAADAATATNYVYASITGTTQDQRAAKLLTNLYRAINSYDINVRANIDRSSNTTLWVISTAEGPDADLASNTSDNTGGDMTVTTYAETDGCGVYSYFYKDNETDFEEDPSNYQTDLSGVSDFRGHNIKINTNSADGYTLQIRDEGPDSTSPFFSWSDSTDLGFGLYAHSQSSRWGGGGSGQIGNTSDGDDLVQEAFQGGEADNVDPQGLSTTYQTLARNDVSTARDNIMLEYMIRIDADQPAGNYQNTLDVMLSAQY